jgi:hypothetical protein
MEQDYLRERERSEIFHKNLWDELHKERRRREEAEDHVWFEDRWMVASLCDE